MGRLTKKTVAIMVATVIMLGACIGLGFALYTPRDMVLKIYNWEDFFCKDVLKKFENKMKETNPRFKVRYETFSDNEEMFRQFSMQQRDYDIAIPSDYMVEKMMQHAGGSLLQPIDLSKIDNDVTIYVWAFGTKPGKATPNEYKGTQVPA